MTGGGKTSYFLFSSSLIFLLLNSKVTSKIWKQCKQVWYQCFCWYLANFCWCCFLFNFKIYDGSKQLRNGNNYKTLSVVISTSTSYVVPVWVLTKMVCLFAPNKQNIKKSIQNQKPNETKHQKSIQSQKPIRTKMFEKRFWFK